MRNRIAEGDIVDVQFASIDMQAVADFAWVNLGNTANSRDDS